jgi:cysteinyl-tRNA synthetase
MIKFYNTLTKKEEEFKPIKDKQVGLYTCGPTVYSYVTVGNWRTYTLSDTVVRTLRYLGYDVKYVMNITDVGHLTGDNEGDSSTGEDRMEKAEKREGKTAWEIAEFYADDFYKGLDALNLIKPDVIPKPTEHIQEQIDLVKDIEKAGFVYEISDGMYFDVKKYEEAGNKYGELSNLDEIKEGARVAINPEKKDPRDFALWKFSPKESKRHMEWQSPWGIGFPGWHIECSAMGMKYLGEQFDIHIGGEDLRSTHHPCEIAQSEAATEKKPFVKYWIHGAFLLVDSGRMGKSLGNAYTLHDIVEKGYSPLDLRYFYFTGHYRKKINFTWEALDAAKVAREKLVKRFVEFKNDGVGELIPEFVEQFNNVVSEDFNMPKAIAVVHELIKSEHADSDKYTTLLKFDEVLGLGLDTEEEAEYSAEVNDLIVQRNKARAAKDWKTADSIRDRLQNEFGVEVKDRS